MKVTPYSQHKREETNDGLSLADVLVMDAPNVELDNIKTDTGYSCSVFAVDGDNDGTVIFVPGVPPDELFPQIGGSK